MCTANKKYISRNNENYDSNKCELLRRNVSSHSTNIFHSQLVHDSPAVTALALLTVNDFSRFSLPLFFWIFFLL